MHFLQGNAHMVLYRISHTAPEFPIGNAYQESYRHSLYGMLKMHACRIPYTHFLKDSL